MPNINARMPGKHCKWGCCPVGDVDHRQRFMKDELALAEEELVDHPNELEDDPDWDGAFSYDPDDVKNIPGVKFFPAD